jgi:hypothetical protein
MRPGRRWRAVLAVAALAFALAQPAGAQYFGRNKIQYKTFRFEVMRTDHFDIYFYPSERAAALQAARMAERWCERLTRIFAHALVDRQPLIIYGSHPEFEQTNVIEGELGEGTGGVTERFKRRIVLPLGASLAESDHVIGHELVHAFQFDIGTAGIHHLSGGDAGIDHLPLWFIEGLAEYLSIGADDPLTAMWMRDAAAGSSLPSIHDLGKPRYFPYRWGQALWAYLTGRYGDDIVGPVFRTAALGGDAEAALRVVLGVAPAELTKQWHAALREHAAAVRKQTRPLSDYGRAIERDPNELSTYNISPSISPDGRRLMFMSQRDLLSIDLFLADASSGRVVRKVTNTATDPHFSSLQTINSAGAWSPDGRRFVFSVVHGGMAHLAVIDADSGRTEQEVPIPMVGEIFSPSWAPDGQAIVFSALHDGVTDLFVFDVAAKTTRQLTDDAYADLQPVWAPDGRTFAFVTDRYTTRLNDCAPGAYQIALLEVGSGSIRVVGGADEGKNINPQWVADGELLFVSDRSGISDIYRVTIATGRLSQVTDVATGVGGITVVSPAISYATKAGRLVFSAYEKDKYSIFAIDDARVLAGQAPAARLTPDPSRLPPEQRVGTFVADLRKNEDLGSAGVKAATTAPYKTHLTLDQVGQPYITAGVGSNGAFAGGGTAFFWSDLLGDYGLGTAVEVNGSFINSWSDVGRSIGGQVTFVNRKHRWNYGVAMGQAPWLAAGFALGVTESNGQTVGIQELAIYRQVERSASGIAYYPFNAAERLEVSAGFSHISFDNRVEMTIFDPNTGRIISDEWTNAPAANPLALGQFSAAFVHDTASYGATSPISGESYRVQVTRTAGTLQMTDVLADYRRYVMPVPFYTLAGRILHYGRYGHGGEDPRLVPIYLGAPTLVRGYDVSSFSGSECTVTPAGSCQEFDRLLGSRVLVGNLEWRFPLLRPFGVKSGMYGPIPTEIAVFADAGVAWNAGERPTFFGGQRQVVSSVGVAVRARLFNLLILEFDVSNPFQRRGSGPVFQLNVSPGF